jgi:hypothetical protein
VCFEIKAIFSSSLKNALAYYSAGVVAVNSKVVGLTLDSFRKSNQMFQI